MADKFEMVKELAKDCGFAHVGDLDVSGIEMRQDVRDVCAQNICGVYGSNWACPPGCGTLEECRERVGKYRRGLILQTTGDIEDSMDFEGMEQVAEDHDRHFREFGDRLREQYPEALLAGAHGCKRCKTCAYPGEPCRFPGKASVSMEGLGLVLSDVCKGNGIPFHYGPDTQTHTAFAFIE